MYCSYAKCSSNLSFSNSVTYFVHNPSFTSLKKTFRIYGVNLFYKKKAYNDIVCYWVLSNLKLSLEGQFVYILFFIFLSINNI